MAPLPANNTSRLFVRQSGIAGVHDTVLRFMANVSQADAITRARAICTAAAPLVAVGIAFIGARWQAAGSNVSFPVVWGAEIPGTDAGSWLPEEKPQFLSMTGRSIEGRRCRLTLFGWGGGMGSDYRFHEADAAIFNTLIDAVADNLPALASISGQPVIWNRYLNTGRNAYYQRKMRRGG